MIKSYEIKNYEDIRSSLRVRVMDIKENAAMLQDILFEPVGCGLAMVPYMELSRYLSEDGIANVPASFEQLDGASRSRILDDAMKGSVEEDHPKLCSVQETLFGPQDGPGPQNYLEGGDIPEDCLLVLTTEKGRLGASALLYPGMKEKLGEVIGGDYYILPSSVHEVLILPDRGETAPKDLARMVKDINENVVKPEDRLCNKVFRYRLKEQELTVAADPDRNRDRER